MATATITNSGSVTLNTVTRTNSTSTATSTSTANTFTLSETAYAFMRAKTITFTAEGLKPNTRYYPFFNGIYIGSFCAVNTSAGGAQLPRALNAALNSDVELKTDSIGRLIGNFYMPSNTFVVGSHTFSLVDNVRTVPGSTTFIPDPIYGQAEARYEANGILRVQQTQVTTNTTVNTSTTATTTSTANVNMQTQVELPPVVTCETRSFTYAVTTPNTSTFTITTNSPTPPSAAEASNRVGGAAIAGSVTYVSTRTDVPNQTYHHLFGFRQAGGSGSVQVFRQDWIGPTTDPDPDLSNFRPSGINGNVQILTGWTKGGSVACPTKFGLGAATQIGSARPTGVVYTDPLAQSFLISSESYPEGVFVTSIAVYFKTVDQSTPVILELRNMINGVPGPSVFPGARVLNPGHVCAQSPDASIATVFRFDIPVYLAPNSEYCFVVRSASLGYNLWCSKTGAVDVSTGKVIDTNSFEGVLFKSENNATWIPDSYEDIKFDLNIAAFETNQTANLLFVPQSTVVNINNVLTPLYYSNATNLPLSYISTKYDTRELTINIPGHNMVVNDFVTIAGIGVPTPVTYYNNILAEQLNGTHKVTEVVDGDTIRIVVPGTNKADRTGNLNVQDALMPVDLTPAVMPPQADMIAAVAYVNTDTFSPSTITDPSTIQSLSQPLMPEFNSTRSFTIYANIPMNEVLIDYMGTEFDQTGIIEQINTTSARSESGAEVPYQNSGAFVEIRNPADFYEFETPQMIATPVNEQLHSTEMNANSSVTVKFTMSSALKDVSPIVDSNGMSLIVRSYVIDNQSGEIEAIESNLATAFPNGPSQQNYEDYFNNPTLNSEIVPGSGKAAAKYKSTINRLSTPYQTIQLFVTGTSPQDPNDPDIRATIDAYVRVSADDTTHQDRNWIWMPVDGVYGTPFVSSSSSKVVNEWMYELELDEPFTVFDVKLVMRSKNNSVVPKIFGVRTICN